MAANDRIGPVHLREARILTVDEDRWVVSAQFVRGEEFVEDIPFFSPMVSRVGGAWMGGMPVPGDFALLAKISASDSWAVLAFRPLARVDLDGQGSEFEETRSNFAMGRAPARSGDMGVWGLQGQILAARADGVVEVVCDELTFTRYFPDTHRIHEVFVTQDQEGPWGASSTYTSGDEESIQDGFTPTGKRAWLKAHAEGPPTILFQAGAVEEEEHVRLPGKEKRSVRTKGSVRFRWLIFDPETADEYFAHGEEPDPTRARFSFRVDEEGNVQFLTAGTRTESMAGLIQTIAGRENRQVLGSSRTEVQGDAAVISDARMELRGEKGVQISSSGDVRLRCRRFIVEAENDRYDVRGDYVVRAGAALRLSGAGAASFSTGGDMTLSSGRGRADVVGGSFKINVLNAAEKENKGRDVLGYGVRLNNGKLALEAVSGSAVVSIGPPDAPLAEIRLHQDKLVPTQIGRITIGFPRTGAGLTLSPNGAWELRSRRGGAGVSCDAAGRIQVGKPSPVVGNVVTTLTHPVCFITGLPIRGASDVVVAAGPQAPGPGVPSVGVVPPTVRPPEQPGS